jgi:predicted nucleic acid-binding protein
MEPIVVDSNVLIASFLEQDRFHQRSQQYIDGLEGGDYTFHLPMLVMVEVIAAIRRQTQGNRQQALLLRAKKSLYDWERDAKIIPYTLDRLRMENSISVAEQHALEGADSIIAALAEELDLPLKTFDTGIWDRFMRASI